MIDVRPQGAFSSTKVEGKNIFDEFDQEQHFHAAWNAIEIRRPVRYSLFTFGESRLPYFLVTSANKPGDTVSITKGEVKITRPTIITAENAQPEFRNFFDNMEEEGLASFLMSRTAGFSHLQLTNQSGPSKIVSDSMDEAVDRLNRQLDAEEEEHVAVLTAPPELTGIALFRYAAERIWSSAPDNIQELRERGFLP